MSGDPEQEYFADGVVEEIITAFSRVRWLFVIARNSSFTYRALRSLDLGRQPHYAAHSEKKEARERSREPSPKMKNSIFGPTPTGGQPSPFANF